MNTTVRFLIGLLFLCLYTALPGLAFPIQVQLVKQQAPAQLVTTPDAAPDRLVGGYVDRCEVFIDGKNPYPARDAEAQRQQPPDATIELAAGKHTLTPGNHAFTVSTEGVVTSESPALQAEGNRLRVLMAPLRLETRDAESGAVRVPGVLQPALDAGGRVFNRPWWFNPRYPTVAQIYVPVNSSLILQPQGAQLEVGEKTVVIKTDPTNSLQAKDLTVTVTMTPFRFTMQRNGHQDGRGISLSVQGSVITEDQPSVYQWGAATCDYKWLLPASLTPYSFSARHSQHEMGRMTLNALLAPVLSLDNRAFPYASLLLSRLDERSEGTFTLLAAIPKLKYRSGDTVAIRTNFAQDGIIPALKDPHIAVLLRPERATTTQAPAWQTITTDGAGEQLTVNLPADLSTDRYRLRLAIVAAGGDSAESTLFRDFVIGVVNPTQRAVASLFLPALRWRYLMGEEIEAQGTLQLNQPAAGYFRLRVRGERLNRLLDPGPTRQYLAGRHGQGWVLSKILTSSLKPGEYSLSTVFAGKDGKVLAESVPQRVTLISTVRRRLFPGIVDSYGDGWMSWLGGGIDNDQANQAVADGARYVFGVGVDALRFDSWYQMLTADGAHPMESEIQGSGITDRPVLPDDPELPPVAQTTIPRMLWRSFDHALEYDAAILPSLFPSDGPRIETMLPDLLAEQRRFVRLHVQYMRRYPNYAGIGYSHWSGPSYTGYIAGTTNPPPDDNTKATRQAIWADFCKKNGVTGDPPTNWHMLGIPSGGAATPANPQVWEKWVRYIVTLLPGVFRDWARAAGEVCPQLINTDSRGAPGYWAGPREAYDGYYHGNHYQSAAGFNLIEEVTNDDWGIEPYSLEVMADLNNFAWRQGKPVWVGGWAQNGVSQSEYQREALQTLARGALPALYGASLAPVFASRANDDWMHQDWGRRQATERVFQTTAAYGEWAWRFTPEKPLAILASFTQSGLTEGRAGYANLSPHGAAVYEAYVACLLAGHSPTFIYEEEIAADPTLLSRYKGVLLINITRSLPDNITRALQAFAAKGGTVLADSTSAPDLPATARLPFAFDAYLKYGNTEFGKEMNSSEYTSGYWYVMRQVALAKRDVLQEALGKITHPTAQSDKPGVLLSTSRAGDGLLVYATNDTPLPYKYSIDMKRPYAYLHQCWTSSEAKSDVTVQANDGVLYDALQLREVPVTKTADGLRFAVDFADLSGKLFVLLPRRIGSVALDGTARSGALALRARVLDEAGKVITTPVPLEIVVTDAAKVERYRIYRAAAPEGWAEELPVAVNDALGAWTVTVRELLSGRSMTASISIQPAAWPEAPAARSLLIVTDKAAVTAFLKSPRMVTIALDRRQTALQPLTNQLVEMLATAKHPVRVRWLDELPRGPLYSKLLWSGSPLLPAEPVQGPIILLGTPQENALLTELERSGVLLRVGSVDYPGGDGAVITHVWSAFSGDDPALAVMAGTAKGLRAAIAQLGMMLKQGAGAGGYDPVPALEKAREQVMPPLFRSTWAKRALVPAPIDIAVLKALKPLNGSQEHSPDMVITPGGTPIRALAASADSKVFAVGTDGASRNVIRIQGEATDAYSPKRQFVQQIALTPDGRYTVFATTQPPAVAVLDTAGNEVWSKTDIPFDWGSDPRWTRDEPDYFALSPDGNRVVVREEPQRLACYETATGKQLWERSYASADARVWRDAHRLRFSGDGSRLVASVKSYLTDSTVAGKLANTPTESLDADLKLLDTEARHRLLLLDPATGEVRWSRSERTIPVPASSPRGHPFFKPYTPRPDLDQRGLVFQPRVTGYYLTVSRDGGRIVAADEYGYHSLYDGDGNLLASYAISGRPCISPDGTMLAVYRDGVTVVNLQTGTQETVVPDGVEVSDVAWSLDNARLAFARWDGRVQVLKLADKVLNTVQQPSGVGSMLLPLSDGGWLAGTSHGHLLRLDTDGRLIKDNAQFP